MNVSPLLGNVRNAGLPLQTGGQTLPPVPGSTSFSSVLTNLMALLKGLFDSPGIDHSDYSKDLGLGPQTDLVRDPGSSDPHVSADPLRDFSLGNEDVRKGLREAVEKKLDELPYEKAAVAIDEIRQLVKQIDQRGLVGEQSQAAGQLIERIVKHVHELQRQFGLDGNATTDTAPQRSENALPLPEMTQEEGQKDSAALPPRPTAPVKPPTVEETVSMPELKPAPKPETPPPPAPEPASALRVQTPAGRAVPKDVLNVKVDEAPTPPPAPEQVAARVNPATLPPVAQAAAAAAQVEAPVANSARIGVQPVQGAEGVVSRGPQSAARGEVPNPMPRTAERVDFVEKVLRAAKLTKARGTTRMRIVLNPPELGAMRVNLAVKDHVLNGTIHTDNFAAREVILNHLQSLKDSLEQQGIEVGEFNVDVEQGTDQSSSDPHRADHGASSRPAPDFRAPESVTAGPTQPVSDRLQLIDLVA